MTRSKIAISLPKEQLVKVGREVRAGRADSVSGYISQVLAERKKRESLGALLRDLVEQYGEPAAEDVKWAERAPHTSAGIVFETGALIALDRGDKRMIALLIRALAQGRAFRVPAGAEGQAWRDGRRQVTLARFLRSDEVEIVPLDGQLARACRELCRATNSPDVIDASVAIIARERQDPIATSNPNDVAPVSGCADYSRLRTLRSIEGEVMQQNAIAPRII